MSKAFAGPRRKTIGGKATSTGPDVRRSVVPLTEQTGELALGVLLPDQNGSRSLSLADQPAPACAAELDRLYGCLDEVTTKSHPRTAKLLGAGTRKIAQKVIEEAGEVALEAVKHRTAGVVRESADLLYHLVALWRRVGVDPGEVWNEMQRRADTLGIAEKLPKPSARTPKPSKD
jgi:phosphoribosyl-ATP pyrophosphohydrolase